MEKETIEKPMKMNYREAYAWQLGWDKGFKAGVESVKEDEE